MRSYRTQASLLLVGSLLAGALTGCSGSGNSGNTPSPTQNAATADPKEPVTIEWLAYNNYGEPDPDSKILKMVEEKFGAKFKVWYLDNQKYNELLSIKLAAGEMPDTLRITDDIPKLVNNGVLAPIEEETIRKYAPNYAKLVDSYPDAWQRVTYEGKLYGLPYININGDYPMVTVWREDWLRNVGITKTPETLQEVEEALTRFRNNDPDQNGKKDTYGISDYALPSILGAFGKPGISSFKGAIKNSDNLDYIVKDGVISFAAIQPEMKEALALLQKWYKAELIDPEFITSENTSGYWADSQALYNNKIGMTSGGMFYHWRNEMNPDNPDDKGGTQYQNFLKSQPNGKLVLGKAPVGPDGKSGNVQWGVHGLPFGLTTKGASNPRIVETFLRMIEATISDYDYFMLAFQGIEGEDWTVKNEMVVNLKPQLGAAERAKKGIAIFNVIESPEYTKKNDPFTYAFADKYKSTGYTPPITPTVESYGKNKTNLGKLVVDSYLNIILGEASIDSFDTFVQTFKANGGDLVEKDVNEEYKKMLGK
ncbi:extracellular solute-binding protein [Paenibacillus sp. GCM10023252]|uniref:extracellular solute-binding protein n=1 Tax=Paenibacillus sp. GCM10023252 TaxID=3252649 RepID=UPI003609A7A8